MTDYGLTETGFVRKPASEIKADIITKIRKIPGAENTRITSGSFVGNLIDVFVNELSLAWEAVEARNNALNPDEATNESLDADLALVGKSRNGGRRTLLTLTLWTTSASSVFVVSGNQVTQPDTEIIFETTEDAIIPGAVDAVENLVINNITWQSGTTVRYTFNDTPDLSSAVAGDLFICTGAGFSSNNITAKITAVNDGSDYIEVENPLRTDAAADETGSLSTGTITDGFVDSISAQAVDIGEFSATAQSVNAINTPVNDWGGVVNLTDGITGRAIETDDEFRARAYIELQIAQGGTLEAIKARLRNDVDGVTYVAGEQNRTAVVSGGNAPHSYRLTVVGGTDQDIINMIGIAGGAGIETNGSVSGTYTDPEGEPVTIYFDRVTEVKPFIIVNVTTDSNYPTDGDQLIKDALTSLVFAHGEDIVNAKLFAAVFTVPGLLTIEVLQGLSDPPTVSTNISISPTELAVLVAERITVSS